MILWLLVGLLAAWCWYRKKRHEEDDAKGIPKGSLGWPIVGETLQFILSGYSPRPARFMEKRKLLYGKVFKTNILGTPLIISTDPEVNKVVLQNNGSIFIPAYPKSTMEIIGENSILRTNGYLQKKVHALIGGHLRSPQFKKRITKEMQRAFVRTMSSWRERGVVHVQNEAKEMAFEVLIKALMSVEEQEQLQYLKREFCELMKAVICVPLKVPGSRLYKSLKARERLLATVGKIVEERRLAEGDVPNDAVDVLIRDREQDGASSLPRDFVTSIIVEMMIPGEETVPTAMTMAVKFLSDNPQSLETLREENMELKRRKAREGDEYTWQDYMSLSFTQSVISETFRLANIINGVWRKAEQDVEIKGYFIPKGWCLMAAFISVHMDEENFENPCSFDPIRFEQPVSNNLFTPFGGGQRLCPGLELSRLEIAVFLHHLVTTYEWVAEDDKIVYFPTVKMRRKLPIKVVDLVH